MRSFLLIVALLLLFAAEILRVYLIMPFPGSQRMNSISFAYWLSQNILWIRILLLLVIAYPVTAIFRKRRNTGAKVGVGIALLLYAAVFYMTNFQMQADKMFYQPVNKQFASGAANKVSDDKLVVGVAVNGEAKAFPIQFIGYHHQVRDSVGGVPVMVTYCTVCRTGRVYLPAVNDKIENFRLVGMDHFNAMFEDAGTHSWWAQATGEAIAGPLKGKQLQEIPSMQVSLAAWKRQYPNTTVLQADSNFKTILDKMVNYETGKSKSDLTKRDAHSWKEKSWVVGIVAEGTAKAYDWNELTRKKLLSDSINGHPVLIALEKDSVSFHAWSRTVNGQTLQFQPARDVDHFSDVQTGSLWNFNGTAVEGTLSGTQLQSVKAYQEYWHSWKYFHPNTLR